MAAGTNKQIDVFISRKSEDAALAKQLYLFLTAKGLQVFDSDEALPKMGNTDYLEQIDKALESCAHMIVLGSLAEHIQSRWVKKEWSSFINEKLSGRKDGNLLTVIAGGWPIQNLPLSLRNYQVIPFDENNFESVAAYLKVGRSGPEADKIQNVQQPLQPDNDFHFQNYIRKKNPDFGKPKFTASAPAAIQHLFSLPAGFNDLRAITPDNAGLVAGISFYRNGKYIITYTKEQRGAVIWDAKSGEPIQKILPQHTISKALFGYDDLLIYTNGFELYIFREMETIEGLHGVKWQMFKEEKIPVPTGFTNPVLEDVAGSSYGDECAILIREVQAKESRKTLSAVLVQERSYAGSSFRTLLSVTKNILRVKRIGKKVFAAIAEDMSRNRTVYIQGENERQGNDIVFVSSQHVIGIYGTTFQGLSEMGIQMDDYATDIHSASRSAGSVVLQGSFDLAEGGYEISPVFSEARLLVALSGRNVPQIIIAAPSWQIMKVLKGHTDTITRLVWGMELGTSEHPVPTNALQYLLAWKQRTAPYTSALLSSASRDGTIKIWQTEAGQLAADFQNVPVTDPVFEWSPNGCFAYADRDGFVHAFRFIQNK